MQRYNQGYDNFMGGGGLGGDGLLGEGPGGGGRGGFQDPMSINQQLMIAQNLLQQQQALTQRLSMEARASGDMGGMGGGFMGGGFMMDQRKRMGPSRDRNYDSKRRRQDSSGRGGDRDNRSRNRDNNRGKEGRSRQSRWDSGDKEDYDPEKPTDDDGNSETTSKDKDGNLHCHVCNVSVYDQDSLKRHLNGTKHASRMNSLFMVSEMKSTQLKSRLKAEEHLRSIERKGGRNPDFFCKICNNDLTIPWKRHCFSNIHKQRLLQVRRGCGWCKVHDFNNFTEVLEHRETEEHKKNAEIEAKKEKDRPKDERRSGGRSDRRSRRRREEEEEDLTLPEYDAEKTFGVNYIIPVTGFFCKLCHKFYNNEKSAKGTHCQSEAHYEKFKVAIEAKIEEREKRKAEEAAEEAKRKEEEEAKAAEAALKKEGEGEEEDGVKEEVEKDDDDVVLVEDDDEDYNDALPHEDEDGDGGLLQPGMDDIEQEESSFVTAQEAEPGSFLDDTNANASFEFLSGNMAEAQMELKKAEQVLMDQGDEEDPSVTEDQGSEDAGDLSGGYLAAPPSAALEDSMDTGASQDQPSGDEENNEEAAEEAPATPRVRRATARRGRGRGRGKK